MSIVGMITRYRNDVIANRKLNDAINQLQTTNQDTSLIVARLYQSLYRLSGNRTLSIKCGLIHLIGSHDRNYVINHLLSIAR